MKQEDIQKMVASGEITVPRIEDMTREELEQTVRVCTHHHEEHHMREEMLLDVVKKCRDQFALYVRLHLEKNPPDVPKAESNAKFEEICNEAIKTIEEMTA